MILNKYLMSALGRPRKAGRGSLEPWKGTSQTTSSQVPVSVIVFVEGGFSLFVCSLPPAKSSLHAHQHRCNNSLLARSGSLTLNRNKIMKAGTKERKTGFRFSQEPNTVSQDANFHQSFSYSYVIIKLKGRFGNAILDIKMKVQYKLSNNTMKVQHQTSNLSAI